MRSYTSPQGSLRQRSDSLLDESFDLLDLTRGKGETGGTRTLVATDDGMDNNFWDGDDMTMEMMTDVNDGEIDEEASDVYLFHTVV